MTPEQKALVKEWLTLCQFMGEGSYPPGPKDTWRLVQELMEKALADPKDESMMFCGQHIYSAYAQTVKHPLGQILDAMSSMNSGVALNVGHVSGIMYGLGLAAALTATGPESLRALVDSRKAEEAKKPVNLNDYRKAPSV